MDRKKWIGLAIFAAVVAVAPRIAGNPYYLLLLTFAGMYALVTTGMCVLIGYAGQISLGHAAFFAIGGYTSAILTTKLGMPLWVGFLAAIGLASSVAFLIGIPTLRLRGHYLAMATLGFGEIVYYVLLSSIELTGGSSGISGVPPLKIFGFDFTSNHGIYYYALIWTLVGVEIVLAFNLIGSRPGRALMSIHGNEEAAEAMGVNAAAYKLKIFVLSAAFTALAGFLYAHEEKYIGLNSSELMLSIILVAMVAVGGMANIWGTLVATVFLYLLPEFLTALEEMDVLAYGVVIMLIMIFMPKGLFVGSYEICRALAAKLRSGGENKTA